MPRKKRNPTDATLRNVRASRTRDEALARRVARLEAIVRAIEARLSGSGIAVMAPVGSRGRTR